MLLMHFYYRELNCHNISENVQFTNKTSYNVYYLNNK